MSTNRRVVLFSALLLAAALPASAGVIILDDKSDFVGDYTVIDFETRGDGTPLILQEGEWTVIFHDEYAPLGVITSASVNPFGEHPLVGNARNAQLDVAQTLIGSLPNSLFVEGLNGFVRFDFNLPINAIGLAVIDRPDVGPVRLEVYDNGCQLIEAVDFANDLIDGTVLGSDFGNDYDFDYGFMGLFSPEREISYAIVYEDIGRIDDLHFGIIPEPGTITILAFGVLLVGVGNTLRSRRRLPVWAFCVLAMVALGGVANASHEIEGSVKAWVMVEQYPICGEAMLDWCIQEPLTQLPLERIRVCIGDGPPCVYTDRNGDYGGLSYDGTEEVTVNAGLDGQWTKAGPLEDIGEGHLAVVPRTPLAETFNPANAQEVNFVFNAMPDPVDEVPTAEATGYYHTMVVRNFFVDRYAPEFTAAIGLDDVQMGVGANSAPPCNPAWLNHEVPYMQFHVSGGTGTPCANHVERTHVAVLWGGYMAISALALASEVSELSYGFGDATALLVYDRPILFENIDAPLTCGANYNFEPGEGELGGARMFFPCSETICGSSTSQDYIECCAQILAGIWWDIRLQLKTTYTTILDYDGPDDCPTERFPHYPDFPDVGTADQCALEVARQLFVDWSSITAGEWKAENHGNLAVELLRADDHDNDLWNGSTHYKEICAAVREHSDTTEVEGRELLCPFDANGNGKHDYMETLEDGVQDQNENGVPDGFEEVIYVDSSSELGDPSGTSWDNAYRDLRVALLTNQPDPERPYIEFWVAQGTYTPHPGCEPGSCDCEYTFMLRDGVRVYGGFQGDEEKLTERPPGKLSVLSGDLERNDNINGDITDNSYNVVTVAPEADVSTLLDGFIITGGHAQAIAGTPRGAGMLIHEDASPTIRNCRFRGNRAYYEGGGVYIWGGNPVFINCTLQANYTSEHGAAVYNNGGAPRFVNCTLAYNYAGVEAGGIYNNAGDLIVRNCVLWNNCVVQDWRCDESTQVYTVAGAFNVTYSCIQDLTVFDNGTNIGEDPLLSLYTYPVCHLRVPSNSPCLDAGYDEARPGSITADLAGKPRVAGNGIDMGAYEYAEYRDCQPNLVPDQCESDCHAEGCEVYCNPDTCAVLVSESSLQYCGQLLDCNDNLIPDECDIADCDGSPCCSSCNNPKDEPIDSTWIPDECENDTDPQDGYIDDCDENGVWDGCDRFACSGEAWCDDCNGNEQLDICDIAGDSTDCDGNGKPDECHSGDCNHNDTLDVCDISGGVSADCNSNWFPDECETDCQGNGIPDDCDLEVKDIDFCPPEQEEPCYVEHPEGGTAGCNPYRVIGMAKDQQGNDIALNLDGQGDNDLVASFDCSSDDEGIVVLRNGGDGLSFVAQEFDIPGSELRHFPRGLCAGYFDDNSQMDLAVALRTDPGKVAIYLNASLVGDTVQFGPQEVVSLCVDEGVCKRASSIATHDLDGDGDLDLVVGLDYSIDEIYVLYNNGSGGFETTSQGGLQVGGNGDDDRTKDVAIGDITGDGGLEIIVVGKEKNDEDNYQGAVFVFHREGTDVDAQLAYDTSADRFFLNGPEGTDDEPIPCSVALDDLDRDGDLDVVTANSEGDTSLGVAALLNKGREQETWQGFGDPTYHEVYNHSGSAILPDSVASGDVNGDGFPDVIVADDVDKSISVLSNDRDGGFDPPIRKSTGHGASDVAPSFLRPPPWNTADLAVANYIGDPDAKIVVFLNYTDAPDSFDLNGNGAPDECETTQTILYVDGNRSEIGDGETWDTAFKDLGRALRRAQPPYSSSVTEIRVAEGTYVPNPVPHLDARDATFELPSGVGVYGGYAGSEANPTNPDERNVLLYETILSGDIGRDDDVPCSSDEDCAGVGGVCLAGLCALENAYHVVSLWDTATGTSLDGFTITRGCADGGGQANGAGLFSNNSTAVILDCVFRDNWADGYGGGVYSYHHDMAFVGCHFIENASHSGGGAAFSGIDAQLINCMVKGNVADGYGGAVFSESGSLLTAVNTLFSGNEAARGGGLYVYDSDAELNNCTLSANQCVGGGAIYSEASSGVSVANSILWGNEPDQIYYEEYPISVRYSVVQGGYAGEGNIHLNPLIRNPVDDDFRVLSGSPAIDAGDNNAIPQDDPWDLDGDDNTVEVIPIDLGGGVRMLDDPDVLTTGAPPGSSCYVDMGAYEYQPDCNDNGLHDDCDLSLGCTAEIPTCGLADCNVPGCGEGLSCPSVAPAPEQSGPSCTAGTKFCHGGTPEGDPCTVNEDCLPNPGGMCLDDCWGEWSGASCVVFDHATGNARCYIPKNRYLTIDPTINREPIAYHVSLDTESIDGLDDQYASCGVIEGFLSAPVCFESYYGVEVSPQPEPTHPCQGEYDCDGPPPSPCTCFGWVSNIVDAVEVWPRVWHEYPLFVTGCEVVPAATYLITPSSDGIAPNAEPGPGTSLEIMTSHEPSDIPQNQFWGDVSGGPEGAAPSGWSPTDYTTSFADVSSVIKAFEKNGGPPPAWCDLEITHNIAFEDISFVIKAFEGETYPSLTDIILLDGRPGIGHEPCDCLEFRGALGGGTALGGMDIEGMDVGEDGVPLTLIEFVLVSSSSLIAGDETVNVDVFVAPVLDLRTYQVALQVSGGDTGSLELEQLLIDTTREDYVFGSDPVVTGHDLNGGRFGAVRMDDGIEVTEQSYLGTFTYRASPDANGIFDVQVEVDEGGVRTFLRDSEGVPVPCWAGLGTNVGVDIECFLDEHCDDANDCTADACVSQACENTNEPAGTPCDDGFFCTETDECDGNGTCEGTGNPCPSNRPKCCEDTDECVKATQECPSPT